MREVRIGDEEGIGSPFLSPLRWRWWWARKLAAHHQYWLPTCFYLIFFFANLWWTTNLFTSCVIRIDDWIILYICKLKKPAADVKSGMVGMVHFPNSWNGRPAAERGWLVWSSIGCSKRPRPKNLGLIVWTQNTVEFKGRFPWDVNPSCQSKACFDSNQSQWQQNLQSRLKSIETSFFER